MNVAILVGRLAKDPETRYSTDGRAITAFTLAVDRPTSKNGQKKQADFPRCIAFGKTAELVGQYLAKGSQCAVEGRIQTGSYTDKEGNKRYSTDVVVNRVTFLDRKKSADTESAVYDQAQEMFGGEEMDAPF